MGGGADQTGSKGAWQRSRRGSIAGPIPKTRPPLYTSSSHPIRDAQRGRACGLNLIVASDTLPTSQTQRWKNCQGVFVRTGLVSNGNWTRTFQRVRDGGTAPKGRRSPLKSSGIQGPRASLPVTRSLVRGSPLWGGCWFDAGCNARRGESPGRITVAGKSCRAEFLREFQRIGRSTVGAGRCRHRSKSASSSFGTDRFRCWQIAALGRDDGMSLVAGCHLNLLG